MAMRALPLLPVRPLLLHALAMPLDEALAAAQRAARLDVAAGALEGADLRRRSGLGRRPAALVGRRARRRLRQLEEAAEFTRVVDLHRFSVEVFAVDDRLAGEEEGVPAVGGHPEQPRVEEARAGRDQRLQRLPRCL